MNKFRLNLLSLNASNKFISNSNVKSFTSFYKKVSQLKRKLKPEFSQLHVKVSTSSQINIRKSMGQQNIFYFEESNLLKTHETLSSNYKKLRETIPVVLLFGWTGAKDSHLKKYADIYSAMGYHTIRFSPSDYTSFLGEHKKYTFELLNLMKSDFNMSQNPILIHSFSNACGFVLYHQIIKLMNKKYDDQNHAYSKDFEFFEKNEKGLISDSGFGWPTNILDLINGIYNLIEKQIKSKPLRLITATSVVTVYNLYRLIYFGNDYFADAFRTILNDTRSIPSLYLYSKADKLISPAEISKFIEKKRQLFPDQYIKSVVYEDAEHVLLYAKYPEDYLKNVVEHLEICKLDLKTILVNSNLYNQEIDNILKKFNPLAVKSKL